MRGEHPTEPGMRHSSELVPDQIGLWWYLGSMKFAVFSRVVTRLGEQESMACTLYEIYI